MAIRRYRVPVVVISGVVFPVYLVWEAHPPGEPRTMRDFLFLLALSGLPFVLLLYDVWSWMAWGAPAAEDSRRNRFALYGLAMGSASAAMLVLLLPLWEIAVQHEWLAECWVGSGAVMSAAGTVCGIIGSPGLRRALRITEGPCVSLCRRTCRARCGRSCRRKRLVRTAVAR